ncbi:MAG: diguanylate cyclase response regulator, partial [Epsilonproteobacteria bacterium]
DHFKNVNDTYGHDIGDIVLKAVTQAANEQKRPNDVFGRIGGEEFAMFMPQIVAKDAEILANKICKSISQLVIKGDRESITVTISIGVTSDANRDLTLSELMKSSDDALYEAKDTGRNRVVAREALPH